MTDYPQLELLIGGEAIGAAARDTIEVLNPATGEAMAALPKATAADLDAALEAASKAKSDIIIQTSNGGAGFIGSHLTERLSWRTPPTSWCATREAATPDTPSCSRGRRTAST